MMRTLADLHAAFGLLEHAADSYAAERDEVLADDPQAVIALQPVPGRRRRRVRPALWLTAAAVAVGLVASGGAVWIATRPDTSQVGGGLPDGSPIMADQLALPFKFDTSTGYQVLDLTISGRGETDLNLADGTHRLMLVLWPKGSDGQDRGHSTSVDINGMPGFYEQDYVTYRAAAPATSVPPDAASASPSSTSVPSSFEGKTWRRHVQWTYAPGQVATLQTLDPPYSADVSEGDLLRVARALDFTRTTPVRSPFALDTAPGDVPLTDVWVDFGTDVKDLQGLRISSGWWVSATYRSGRESSGYQVRMHGGSGVEVQSRGVVRTKVDGHAALWSAGDHMLSVDYGNGLFLDILQYTWGPEPSMTLAEATAVARLVRVSAYPSDPAQWFNAVEALPLN